MCLQIESSTAISAACAVAEEVVPLEYDDESDSSHMHMGQSCADKIA